MWVMDVRGEESPIGDPLRPWRSGVTVRDATSTPGRHTIHSYYLSNPESPDGSRVLFYGSTTREGQLGDLYVLDRKTGRETIVAHDIDTEDAHRAACQQWSSNGRRVAFHDVKEGRWSVNVVDLDSLERRVLVQDRQLAFGQPASDVVPIYGCHWKPGPHRNLEFLNVVTGEIRNVVGIDEVERNYGEWLARQFGGKQTSIFFPIVSPDQKRVFFKMACGSGGDNFQSGDASARQGLIAYDLADKKFLFLREKWGHPAWFPDSRRIIEMGNIFLDAEQNGQLTKIAGLPSLRGCHPSVSPDGRLFVMDGLLEKLGDEPNQWGIMVCDLRGGEGRFQVLHKFQNNQGAKSWRRNHPHPIFSADGRRIYFNVSDGEWTRLMVAECSGS